MTMSAESPHKSNGRGGHVVAPQPVSDRSIIESVAGFINEVVPQAYTSLPASDSRECITWARFEYGDINDPALYPETADERSSTPPLLLVLGYGSGVQVWAVPANGEASEVLSWRQGVVRTLRILPTPLADSPVPDAFGHKRPLVALCDSAGPGPQFCSLSFISLRGGDQVKSIKFKNPINDVLANRRSIVVTFPERIAVFDACTLEDRLTVTTCYPCSGPNPNPVALGTRWLAYSERRLLPSRRSSGGMEGEGVQSYTATVLHAAKSLGKGLRELGESVASSLTGSSGNMAVQRGATVGGPGQLGSGIGGGICDMLQPGIISILDAQGSTSGHGEDLRASDTGPASCNADVMIAHFMAHGEPVVALAFDPSGMLLLTADKRGHDFHLFRIQPHPGGPSLAAVHHLYILHRGDTTAKVQDIAFAADSRWVAVSTLRGTTHVFPITPYGGPVGIRTHTTPHVVNRLSRFHRSAGLTADGRNSPVPSAGPTSVAGNHESVVSSPAMPYPNPRLPPYPHPTVIAPLAQIRQPMAGAAPMSPNAASQQVYHRNPPARPLGRSQSLSDDGVPGGSVPLRVSACFAPPRAWLVGSPTVPRDSSAKARKRAVDSLFVMACHGSLVEYDLEPKHVAGIPKEKVCDDTAIELEVEAKAQWLLLRPPHSSELQPPLPSSNPLMVLPDRLPPASESRCDDVDERWLSQVEIVTHAGPHRRLWMGPQFTFKTYSAPPGTPVSLLEIEAVEVGTGGGSRPARSNPVNMPLTAGSRPIVPVLIESGSASSYEQSPRLMEVYGGDGDSDGSAGPGDTQLREDLADAMMESPGVPIRDTGGRVIVTLRGKRSSFPVEKVVNPVGTVITVETGALVSPDGSCPKDERSLQAEGMVKWPTAVKSPLERRSQWPMGGEEVQANSDPDNLLKFTNAKVDESKCDRGKSRTVGINENSMKVQRKDVVKQNEEKDLGVVQEKGEKKRTACAAATIVVIDSDIQTNNSNIDSVRLKSKSPKNNSQVHLKKGNGGSLEKSVEKESLNKRVDCRVLTKHDSAKSGSERQLKNGGKKKTSADSLEEPAHSEESCLNNRAECTVLTKCDSESKSTRSNSHLKSKEERKKKKEESTLDEEVECSASVTIDKSSIEIHQKRGEENRKKGLSVAGEAVSSDERTEYILPKNQDSISMNKSSNKTHQKCGEEKKKKNRQGFLEICDPVEDSSSDEKAECSRKQTSISMKKRKTTKSSSEIHLKDCESKVKSAITEQECSASLIDTVDTGVFKVSKKKTKKKVEEPLVYKEEETELESFVMSMVDRKNRSLPADEDEICELEKSIDKEVLPVIDFAIPGAGEFTFASGMKTNAVEGDHRAKSGKPEKTARTSPGKGAGSEDNSFPQLDLPPLKSWSSIVSRKTGSSSNLSEDITSKVEEGKLWVVSSLNPEVITSTLNTDNPGVVQKNCDSSEEVEDITEPVEGILLSEANFPTMGRSLPKSEASVPGPHRSWSSIVSSSPKAGTSTDEGSGEYDSNESKESTDLGLDELEERSENLGASTITNLVNASISEKPASEEESNEPSAASSKKSRRAKKKRR